MMFSFGQSPLKLPENSPHRAPFPFEKPQPVPKTNDVSLSCSVHFRLTMVMAPNVNEKRTDRKPLGFGAVRREDH
jgi:hypothetical protein